MNDQGPVPPSVTVRSVPVPLQIVLLPLSTAVGLAFTFTVAPPERSAAVAVQLPSLNVDIVYAVVDDGLTFTVIVGAVPLNAVPSDNVPLIVPLPVTARLSVALPPLQIVLLPLSTAVGLAFTFTVAPPERSAAIAVQFASLRSVNVYTVVADGDTGIVYGELIAV